jgi:hypothetical protein
VELHNHVTYVLNGKQELPTSSWSICVRITWNDHYLVFILEIHH